MALGMVLHFHALPESHQQLLLGLHLYHELDLSYRKYLTLVAVNVTFGQLSVAVCCCSGG